MKLKSPKIILLGLLCISFSMNAQTPEEKKLIVKNYDLAKLNSLKLKYTKDFKEAKNEALLLAKERGLEIKFTKDGATYELMKISKEGKLIYYKTNNVDAAISTRTNFLHKDGGLGLNIEGQGMTAYVWDAGLARATHQEYDGDGGDDRFSIGDESTGLDYHAAHVMGTIISSGFDPLAKGMAPQAKGIGYDWNDDIAEATNAAANGMLISNHSYGLGVRDSDGEPQLPAYYFGGYLDDTRDWDNIMYNAPYYLQVVSAGNDGNDDSANSDPLEGNFAYDKLTWISTAKNNLVVASSQDATINADGTLSSVGRSSFSSEGPTDDLRIKPDIMGNGAGLYSSYDSTDDAYNTISGTSMASPNVAGSLLLLQQYYKDINGSFMKAATLKGLVLHTADDVDIPGPDPHVGWGLLNMKVASETITNNGLGTLVSEEVLTNGESYSFTVKSDGTSPLLASISWTDKPGIANTGTINDPTPVLVNDLDIKITQGDATTYNPWRLTGVYSNEKGDNTVDPYERVDIEDASGEYTITVTHKGTLDEAQNFSLIISGVSSDFTFTASNPFQKICIGVSTEAVFNFTYAQTGTSTTTFSANGVPSGANLVFSSPTLNTNGDFNVTIQNLDDVAGGEYPIEIFGDNGNETETRNITLKVITGVYINNEQTLLTPSNGSKGISVNDLTLSWLENDNAETYYVEVSESPSFINILSSGIENDLNFTLNDLELNKIYYWRVRPDYSCNNGTFSEIFSFQTGIINCSSFSATDFTNATISYFDKDETAYVPIPVSIPGNSNIHSLTVTTDITHSRISDLIVYLQEPSELGSNNINLLESPCGDTFADIANTTFDDNGDVLTCATEAPAVTGTLAPQQELSRSNGKDANGTWFLAILDQEIYQGGAINAATINICTPSENTNVPTFLSSALVLSGNASYTLKSVNMDASSTSESEEQQIYTLVEMPTKGSIEKEGTALNVGDTFTQADITLSKIVFTNTQTASFTDQFKVDVTNAANGWLANQIISIEESTLKVDTFLLNNVSIWPNPTKGILNIKLNNTTDKNVIISILDLQGRKIMHTQHTSSNPIFTKEIDTKNISSGIYLLSVKQGTKKVTKKIFISK